MLVLKVKNMKDEIKKRIKRDLLVLSIGAAVGVGGSKISVATHKGEENGVKIEIYQKTPKAPHVLDQEKLDKALFKAAKKGDLDAVKQALENGANINVTDSKGRTPVMIAAHKSVREEKSLKVSKKFYEVAVYLISQNADLLKQDEDGLTIMEYSSYSKYDGSWMSNEKRHTKMRSDDYLRSLIFQTAKEQVARARLLSGGGYTYQY